MKIFAFVSFILCLVTIITPVEIFADTALDVYMNDFYSKSMKLARFLKKSKIVLKRDQEKKFALCKERQQD